ncbi:MAG TPA: GNAT family N-acetyltransferase [Bacteroidia bacterium]|nr:GNAT family N-acetyltransferase [Bacteroidia bacterium]
MLISGENLFLREFILSDAPFIVELLNTPGWIKFIGDRNVHSVEDAIKYLQNGPLKTYSDSGYGFWCVCLNTTNEAVGMCGFIQRDYLPAPDLGFAFLTPYISKGFGYESALLSIELAKKKFNISSLVAITDPVNARSIKLLNRLGFVDAGNVVPPNTEESLLLMKLALTND